MPQTLTLRRTYNPVRPRAQAIAGWACGIEAMVGSLGPLLLDQAAPNMPYLDIGNRTESVSFFFSFRKGLVFHMGNWPLFHL